jgi:hypothetical protein
MIAAGVVKSLRTGTKSAAVIAANTHVVGSLELKPVALLKTPAVFVPAVSIFLPTLSATLPTYPA